jgi:hypothetical protein
MGLFGRYRKKKAKRKVIEKSCFYCENFDLVLKHHDSVHGERLNTYKGLCKIYGEFKTYFSGSILNIPIDEKAKFKRMVLEKAKKCHHFESREIPDEETFTFILDNF